MFEFLDLRRGRLTEALSATTLPFIVLLFLVFVFSYDLIFSTKIPLFRDLGPYFYPMRFSLAESLKAGDLPLWNAQTGLGFPLLANFQSGAFYPPNLVYGLFPFIAAVKITYILHYLVAASGSYLLLDRWKLSKAIVLVGSLLFTFGGYTISLTNLLNHFQTAVWLPWLLLLGERYLGSPNWLNFAPLVFLATTQFLAGSPEIYAMSMGLLLIHALRMRGKGETSISRILFSVLGINVLVAGLAMVQILPTLELLRLSERTHAASFEWATDWSLQLFSLLSLVFLDKQIDPGSFETFQFFFYSQPPFLLSLYMGGLFPFGFWAWIISEERKRQAIVLGLVLLSILLSMGSRTPIYKFLYDYFPYFSLFRFPEKFFFVTFALLLYVAVTGLSYLLETSEAKGSRTLLGPAILTASFLALYLLCRYDRALLLQAVSSSAKFPLDHPLTWRISSSVLVHLERHIALWLGIMAIVWLWQRKKIQARLMEIVIVLIAFVDIFSAHAPYQLLMDASIVQQRPQTLALLQDAPSYRVFSTSPEAPFHPDISQFPRARSPEEHTTFAFQTLRPNTGLFWGVNYMQEIDALLRMSYNQFLQAALKLSPGNFYKLLGALNVKYIMSLHELTDGSLALLGHFERYPAWVYRIDGAVPRAYVVSRVITERDPQVILGRLASDGFDPSEAVILEEAVPLEARKGFHGKAWITQYKNNRARVQATLNAPGVLVLTDSFYPGWRAYVDGKEQDVLRANYFFRAVLLQGGQHVVEFRYQPRSFTMGLYISLAFLAAVSIWSVFLFVRKT